MYNMITKQLTRTSVYYIMRLNQTKVYIMGSDIFYFLFVISLVSLLLSSSYCHWDFSLLSWQHLVPFL